MLFFEELRTALNLEFKGSNEKGINEFLKLINTEDLNFNREYLAVANDTDIILYPGASGDISPCTVLEIKEFENKNGIESNNNKLYIFLDPIADGFDCNFCDGFFYDLATKNNHILSLDKVDAWPIYIGKNQKLVTGYFISLTRGNKVFRILYLAMTFQDFVYSVIERFNIHVKWLFFINMERQWTDFFRDYASSNIVFPQWICANRVSKYNIISDFAELKPMMDGDIPYYCIESEYDSESQYVYYGKMLKPKFIYDNTNC